jgi:phage portal protein BeeE
MASFWKKLVNLFKSEQDVKQKGGWPHWHSLGGHPIYSQDFWGRKTPTPMEMIQAFEDTVYACTSLIADTVSATPVKLYVKTAPGQAKPRCSTRPVNKKALRKILQVKNLSHGYQVEEVCEHPLLDLLNQCNSYHNRNELISLTQLFLEMTGNAFWLIKCDGYGIPVGVFLLPSQYMTPIRDNAGMVTAWRFGQGSHESIYQPEELIHYKFASLDDCYGLGHAP